MILFVPGLTFLALPLAMWLRNDAPSGIVFFSALALAMVLYGLIFIRPRPFQVFDQGLVVPTIGLLGTLFGSGWIPFVQLASARSIKTSTGVELVQLKTLSGKRYEIPMFQIGEEGLDLIRIGAEGKLGLRHPT